MAARTSGRACPVSCVMVTVSFQGPIPAESGPHRSDHRGRSKMLTAVLKDSHESVTQRTPGRIPPDTSGQGRSHCAGCTPWSRVGEKRIRHGSPEDQLHIWREGCVPIVWTRRRQARRSMTQQPLTQRSNEYLTPDTASFAELLSSMAPRCGRQRPSTPRLRR